MGSVSDGNLIFHSFLSLQLSSLLKSENDAFKHAQCSETEKVRCKYGIKTIYFHTFFKLIQVDKKLLNLKINYSTALEHD